MNQLDERLKEQQKIILDILDEHRGNSTLIALASFQAGIKYWHDKIAYKEIKDDLIRDEANDQREDRGELD